MYMHTRWQKTQTHKVRIKTPKTKIQRHECIPERSWRLAFHCLYLSLDEADLGEHDAHEDLKDTVPTRTWSPEGLSPVRRTQSPEEQRPEGDTAPWRNGSQEGKALCRHRPAVSDPL